MAAKTGHKMKLYRNTGTVATPVWSLVDQIGDVNIPDLSRALAELRRRGNEYTKNLPGIINSITLEFRLFHGLGDTTFDAIQAAFFAGTVEEYAVLDGLVATVGTQGLRCPFLVESFPWDQNLDEVSGHDVRLAIGYMESGGSEVDPSWMEVSA